MQPDLRIAVVGLGAIGTRVVEALDRGMDGLVLAAVSVQNPEKHRSRLAGLKRTPAVLPIEALVDVADIVIECAPSALVRSIVTPFVGSGKTAVVLSAGALLDHDDLVELARRNGGQIVVPTGALIGLDAVTAAAAGTIHSVRMVTRKPVRGLIGAPYIVENNIDIEGITEPLRIFDGTAREAARGFPANVNVAAALSMAGIGPDRTTIEIWADPALTRNMHRIEVDFELGPLFHVDREYPVGKPQDGSHHRALRHCLPSQAAGSASRRNLNEPAIPRRPKPYCSPDAAPVNRIAATVDGGAAGCEQGVRGRRRTRTLFRSWSRGFRGPSWPAAWRAAAAACAFPGCACAGCSFPAPPSS